MYNIFILHPQLEADTFFIKHLAKCQLRLMNDSRWPWVILVPEIAAVGQWHHLSIDMFDQVNHHVHKIAGVLEEITACDKINIAALGNVVPQLHIHIVARKKTDANWPSPIWGYGKPVFYEKEEAEKLIKILGETLI